MGHSRGPIGAATACRITTEAESWAYTHLELLDGAGHSIWIERSEDVAALIRDFLNA